MKQPPPPYSQVAMTTSPEVSNVNVNVNMNDSQLVQSQTTVNPASVPTTYDNIHNKVPPAYDEADGQPSMSPTSQASNEMNHLNGDCSSAAASNANANALARQPSQQ